MGKISTVICFLLVSWFSLAQSTQESNTINLDFTPDFIDFSPDDKYMIAENEDHYSVWDIKKNTKIIEGEYNFKIGRLLKNTPIPTGSGYFLFGNEQVFLTIDYQHNNTKIKGFNLKNGSLLWETDQLDIGVTVTETIIGAHAGGMLTVEVNGNKFSKTQKANNFFTRDQFLDRLINYIPAKKAIVINGKDGLQMLDIRNGKTLWTQKDFKGGIGELLFNQKNNKLLAITIPATDGALDLLTTTPKVIALEANTGKILWEVTYTGDFIPNYATIKDNTLILPYLDLTFIDLKTGLERNGDIKNRTATAKNVTKGLGKIIALDKALNGNTHTFNNAPNKYNRLIPRQLYFNNNGKLCYFTIFDKNGKWNTGSKKGYTIIDIHNDKIALEKYAVLDNQWTVMQDALANNIFYIKASGNLNRTIIKAIDAKTGADIFETEKAKNSADIAKAFNPFIVSKNLLIDIVSRGIYILNAKTGEKISYTSTKDLRTGTIKFSELYNNGIIIFGTKAVGVIDYKGNIIANVPAKNVKSFAVTEHEILLLESKSFTRIDAKSGKILETFSFKKADNVAFSPSGKTLAKYKGKSITLIQQ